jgi:hypothetical protein
MGRFIGGNVGRAVVGVTDKWATSAVYNIFDQFWQRKQDTWKPPSVIVHYLVIAGGGGNAGYGGGGAGGYRTSYGTSGNNSPAEPTVTLANSQDYTVTVGGGGNRNSPGNNSTFHTITSLGGGGGYNDAPQSFVARSGGSGAGSRYGPPFGGAAGSGNATQGTPGGTGTDGIQSFTIGGGGGGASSAGTNAPGGPGPGGGGGSGLPSTITGSNVTRAGGGGGISNNPPSGSSGGPGGGGSGTYSGGSGTNGQTNTGGGGGASDTSSNGLGGSGVVILRYPSIFSISNPGGGLTFSTATDGSDKVTSFTAGTGNISFGL